MLSLGFAPGTGLPGFGGGAGPLITIAQPSEVRGYAAVLAASGALDPLTIFGGIGTHQFYGIPDLGTAESGGAGTGLTAWSDQSGAGHHITPGNLPTLTAVDATLGNRKSITLNGSSQYMDVTGGWDPPAPGTSSIYLALVVKINTWSSGKCICSGSNATRLKIFMNGSGGSNNSIAVNNGVTSGANLNMGGSGGASGWVLIEAGFTNSAADFLTVGALANTTLGSAASGGAGFGNGDTGLNGFRLGARNGPNDYAAVSYGPLFAITGAIPGTTPRNNYRSWVTSFTGGAVSV